MAKQTYLLYSVRDFPLGLESEYLKDSLRKLYVNIVNLIMTWLQSFDAADTYRQKETVY